MCRTSPPKGTLKEIENEARGLLYVSTERTLLLDIFSGAIDKDALWLERVQGLENAKRRMGELATKSPGRYFVFCDFSHTVVAQIDAPSEIPSEETTLRLSEVRKPAGTSTCQTQSDIVDCSTIGGPCKPQG